MRMRLVYILIGSLLLNLGCDSIEPKINRKVPENVIEKEKMVEIIYDLQLIQAAYKGRTHTDTNAQKTRDARTLIMLDKYAITQEEFELSLDYYHKSPDDMEDIYEEVITKLNLKIAQLEEKID